jgi:hypothetical protein
MKKSLFFAAAASALMLTACSSENDVVQSSTKNTVAVQQQAVGFDIYTPAPTNVTRVGQAGTMTTSRLQRSDTNGGGFGVYAYLVEDENPADGATDYVTWNRNAATKHAPNFMVNEKVLWNAENLGWYYTPLKYWPNETDNDSQNTNAEMEAIGGTKHLDRLTFFAYAPYVAAGDKNEPGIMHVTDKDGKITALTSKVIEPTIGYKASLDDPSKAVDLLWGVAPSGGLSYTAVNGETKTVNEGEPLIDMVKPDVNTSMKFLFQHALARIGINVVAAVDQVGAGGKLDNTQTRINVKEVTLTGMFGGTGYLNLDNPTADVANWVRINSTAINDETTAIGTSTTLTLSGDQIAPDLRFNGDHDAPAAQTATGVTTSKKDLIAGRYFALDAVPAYTPSKTYYIDANGTVAVAKYNAQATDNYYTYAIATNTYTQVTGDITPAGTYHKVVAENTTYDGTHEQTPAVNYTKASANTYNKANVAGCVAAGDDAPADYNTKVPTVTPVDPNSLTDDEAYAYNCTIAGAKTTADVETPATYGYDDTALPPSTVLYERTGSEGSYVYTYKGTKSDITTWGTAATYCTITPTELAATDIAFAYTEATIYDVERNYFMVVPTNNVNTLNGGLTTAQKEDLRKVRVKIEYYITTEDAKLAGGRAQTKNVIEKDVIFPSLRNGKSYMLNLVLGLTSVKMDAEVDDWKVENVNADLPQNTSN